MAQASCALFQVVKTSFALALGAVCNGSATPLDVAVVAGVLGVWVAVFQMVPVTSGVLGFQAVQGAAGVATE